MPGNIKFRQIYSKINSYYGGKLVPISLFALIVVFLPPAVVYYLNRTEIVFHPSGFINEWIKIGITSILFALIFQIIMVWKDYSNKLQSKKKYLARSVFYLKEIKSLLKHLTSKNAETLHEYYLQMEIYWKRFVDIIQDNDEFVSTIEITNKINESEYLFKDTAPLLKNTKNQVTANLRLRDVNIFLDELMEYMQKLDAGDW